MSNNRGATLVELMVAMVIILIVSLGFFSWLSTVMRMNTSIERSNTAYAMANDVADRLQRMNDNALIQPRSGSSRCVGFDASADLRGCSDTGVNPPPNCNTGGTPQVPLSSNATGPTILTNPNVTAGTLYLYDNNLCAGKMWSDCWGSLTVANINTANGNIDHPNAISSAYDSINPIRSYKNTTYYAVWSVAYMPCGATGTDRRKIFITVYWLDPEPTAATAAGALSGTTIKSVSLVADKTIGTET